MEEMGFLAGLHITEKRNDEMQELTLKAVTDNLGKVTDFVDEILEKNACPMKARMQIDIALEEVFVNIANYAYSPDTGDVLIQCGVENGEVRIAFIDSGRPFDPLKKPDPDITLSAQDRQIGGLGIYMVKKYMDRVIYEYSENKNKLVVTKKIGM